MYMFLETYASLRLLVNTVGEGPIYMFGTPRY